MTKQTAICDALVRLGHKEVNYNSTKYRVFSRNDWVSDPPMLYFVGKNGALRTGTNLVMSFSCSGHAAKFIKRAEKVTK